MPAIDSDWLHHQNGARGQHNSSVLEIPDPLLFPPPIKRKAKSLGPDYLPAWFTSYSQVTGALFYVQGMSFPSSRGQQIGLVGVYPTIRLAYIMWW